MASFIYQLSIWTRSELCGRGIMVVAVLMHLLSRRWSSYRPTVPGDARLKRFASEFVGLIPAYVPD